MRLFWSYRKSATCTDSLPHRSASRLRGAWTNQGAKYAFTSSGRNVNFPRISCRLLFLFPLFDRLALDKKIEIAGSHTSGQTWKMENQSSQKWKMFVEVCTCYCVWFRGRVSQCNNLSYNIKHAFSCTTCHLGGFPVILRSRNFRSCSGEVISG